jgi:hypothetical protein
MSRGVHVGLAFLVLAMVCVATAGTGLAQRPPPGSPGAELSGIQTGTPAISGTVVDAATGQSLPGAVVSLGPGSVVASSQRTDELGRFLFSNLSVLTAYELTAAKPGYYPGAFGRETWDGPPQRIVLSKGQWRPDTQIKLFRPGALVGRVMDRAGDLVAGVRVAALARLPIAGEPRLVTGPSARTDDRGVYRIAPLPPGAYAVMVPSVPTTMAGGGSLLYDSAQPPPLPPLPGGRLQGYATTYHPEARDVGSARMIALAAGEERTGVDVTLSPVPVFNVSGVLGVPPGNVEDLLLRLMHRGSEAMGLGHEAAITSAGPDGRFTFLNVPDGAYTVLANHSAAGYVYTPPGAAIEPLVAITGAVGSSVYVPTGPHATSFHVSSKNRSAYYGRVAVAVSAGHVTSLTIPLQRGGTIRGRVVTDDSLGVRGATPVPVVSEGLSINRDGPEVSALFELTRLQGVLADQVNVIVRAEPANGDPTLGLPEGRASGAGGAEFIIEGILPGDYVIRTSGSLSGAVKSARWNGQDYTEVPFRISPGMTVSDMIVTIDRYSPLAGGTVRDAEGRDVLDATVLCFPVDPSRWRHNGFRPSGLRSSPVGHAAAYRFSRLPAGEYYLVALPGQLASNWQDPAFLARAAGVATRVTLDWATTRMPDLIVASLP